jgi:hypothetical protein
MIIGPAASVDWLTAFARERRARLNRRALWHPARRLSDPLLLEGAVIAMSAQDSGADDVPATTHESHAPVEAGPGAA